MSKVRMGKKKILLVILITVVVTGGVLYKFLSGYFPGESNIKSYLAEKEYERDAKEDALDFSNTPLASKTEEQKIKKSISLATSFYSTRQSGSWGYLHVFVDNGEDIVPEKADAEGYYIRLTKDNNLSCFEFGNVPHMYSDYKKGQARAFTGGASGIDWYWGTKTPTADLIVSLNGKKVLIKNLEAKDSCSGGVE